MGAFQESGALMLLQHFSDRDEGKNQIRANGGLDEYRGTNIGVVLGATTALEVRISTDTI